MKNLLHEVLEAAKAHPDLALGAYTTFRIPWVFLGILNFIGRANRFVSDNTSVRMFRAFLPLLYAHAIGSRWDNTVLFGTAPAPKGRRSYAIVGLGTFYTMQTQLSGPSVFGRFIWSDRLTISGLIDLLTLSKFESFDHAQTFARGISSVESLLY